MPSCSAVSRYSPLWRGCASWRARTSSPSIRAASMPASRSKIPPTSRVSPGRSAPRAPIGRRTACIGPPPAQPRCSCAPPSAAPTWACSPAGCSRCWRATALRRCKRPSPRPSPRMPPIWARCATSSIDRRTSAASPRRSRCTCPRIRGCIRSVCPPSPCTPTNDSPPRRRSLPMTATPPRASLSLDTLRPRLRRLGLYGLLAQADTLVRESWLERLLDIEESERQRRSLKRRINNARLGAFKPLADFDWSWPTKCDRAAIEELFTLEFLAEGANVVLIGHNGLGKTMLLKNLAHQALLHGYSARFVLASDMLHDLAAQDSSTALARRLRRYTTPTLLVADELGYLSYDSRYADLLFEVITRRYQAQRSIALTTNKPFGEWNQVFPNAGCVVTLIDRLVHRSEIIAIEGKSYRLKEAQERAARKANSRGRATRKER